MNFGNVTEKGMYIYKVDRRPHMAIKRERMKKNTGMESLYDVRLEKKIEELRWLYMELYGNDSMFAELCDQMKRFYQNRAEALKELDQER